MSNEPERLGSTTTLAEWVSRIRKAHPINGIMFECGIHRYRTGESRPYDNYLGRMNGGQTLYRLGWDMARRDALLSNEKAEL